MKLIFPDVIALKNAGFTIDDSFQIIIEKLLLEVATLSFDDKNKKGTLSIMHHHLHQLHNAFTLFFAQLGKDSAEKFKELDIDDPSEDFNEFE